MKNKSVPFVFVSLVMFASAAVAVEPPTLEEFAMRPIVRDVDLSPSGEHMAVMRLAGRGLNYVVDVYESEHMDREPHTLGAEHMDIIGVNWANDKRLLIRTRPAGGSARPTHRLQYGGYWRTRKGEDLCLQALVRGD